MHEAMIFGVDGTLAEIEEARPAGWRLASATTRANIDALALALFQRPADQMFDAIAAGNEVAAKKPAPDVYHLAVRRLPVHAVVALEDSRAGLRAAHAAGLDGIVAPGRYTAHQDLSAAEMLQDNLGTLRLADIATLTGPPA